MELTARVCEREGVVGEEVRDREREREGEGDRIEKRGERSSMERR
jgi:hypothetical protein